LDDRCLLSGGITLATPALASPKFYNKIDGIVAEQSSAIAIQSFTVVQQPGSSSSDRPKETLSINYAEVSIHYTQMNQSTQISGTNAGGVTVKTK
jgi:hypothetical protein